MYVCTVSSSGVFTGKFTQSYLKLRDEDGIHVRHSRTVVRKVYVDIDVNIDIDIDVDNGYEVFFACCIVYKQSVKVLLYITVRILLKLLSEGEWYLFQVF